MSVSFCGVNEIQSKIVFRRQCFENAELIDLFLFSASQAPGSHSTLYTRERGGENASLKMQNV